MKLVLRERSGPKERLSGAISRLVVVLIGWAPYATHTGFWNALERGFYKRAGIDAKIIRGYGSADTIKRIEAKNGDFEFADTGTLVVVRSKGA